MKIAVVYNRDSKDVINLFGVPNKEKYGKKSIKRITDALRAHGHQVQTLEGDKNLIAKLEEFMPRVVHGERPGMVFNLSYGVQGQARYTHVPGILEMIGIPYVGSGPLAHSLALDKVVAKMIFKQNGIPTPDFAVLDAPGFEAPDLAYPLIVKPKNESVSFGIQIVHDEKELRAAAQTIFDEFEQPVLAERYIDGREVNVGVLGNNPVETFAPAELLFGDGPKIYTYKDKMHKSGREVGVRVPADLSPAKTREAQDIARRAFRALGCFDCARIDMRMDDAGKLYVLEINSLPSLGEHGSYVHGAEHAGLDFPALVNRLVEVASARYFGTPNPPQLDAKAQNADDLVFSYMTNRRDRIEKRLREWVGLSSRTADPIGIGAALEELSKLFEELRMTRVERYTDESRACWAWETRKGFKGGTLLIAHADVPLGLDAPAVAFRRDPEWIHGEGVGSSRAPLTELEFALRALRHNRFLRKVPLGVLIYSDEGRDARHSSEIIEKMSAEAAEVIVLRPGTAPGKMVVNRRGQRTYRLTVEGRPLRVGYVGKKVEALRWLGPKLDELGRLSSRKDRLALSAVDVESRSFPFHLPHQVRARFLLTYPETAAADSVEKRARQALGKSDYKWTLQLLSDRPPMRERRVNAKLAKAVSRAAAGLDMPLAAETSAWPSVAGLVAKTTPVVCGLAPFARELYTPQEAVSRLSLFQRTLLLARFLAAKVK